MKPLKLKYGPPRTVRRASWLEQEDGSWRCGDVLIRCDERHPWERWHIYRVGKGGELTRVSAKSRPWGYGRAGQAKIGAARMIEPVPFPNEG